MKSNKSNLIKWSGVYKGLGNPNRLQMLKLLKENQELSVGSLAAELKISFKNTSRNLKILRDLNLVEYTGKEDRVYYFLNPKMQTEVNEILRVSIF